MRLAAPTGSSRDSGLHLKAWLRKTVQKHPGRAPEAAARTTFVLSSCAKQMCQPFAGLGSASKRQNAIGAPLWGFCEAERKEVTLKTRALCIVRAQLS